MREFILYSRMGRTDSKWENLHDAGRLDIVYECAVASLFLSHALRRDTVFHAILNGPPQPPLHLRVEGLTLRDVRTDLGTWTLLLKKVLSGKQHPGISLSKTSFEGLIKEKAEKAKIYILEEGGKDIFEVDIEENPVFVLGDHVGLPKKVEAFALRYGEKISLGKKPYLAATCIAILNYLLDRREMSGK
ncbi:MAG: tRNA (pseudouridine(54)-N(1))-methyltransferase TrmY [Candidatus Bathyarchaeia archaeon]